MKKAACQSSLFCVAVMLALTSCRQQRESAVAQTATTDFQRFVPIPTSTPLFEGMQPGNLALDTKTGILCKTWEWKQTSSALDGLPECSNVYVTYSNEH
jgi:hypothetical protein